MQGTRLGADPGNPKVRDIVIDFAGDFVGQIRRGRTSGRGALLSRGHGPFQQGGRAQKRLEKAWRVFLKFEPAPDLKDPVPLRCTLKQGDTVLTETWDYLWNPR